MFSLDMHAQQLKKFENTALSLQYPETWKPDTEKMKVTGTVRLFTRANSPDALETEVLIASEPAKGRTLDMLSQPQNATKDGNTLETTLVKTQIDGIEAYKIISRLGAMHVTTINLIRKDFLWKITCFTAADDFAKYEKDFETIVNSIRFK
jgi:hypothetical protein